MKHSIETLNLQIVCNVGNYETIRIGAEFTPQPDTPDKTCDLVDVMVEMDGELRRAAAGILEARKANIAPAAAPAPQAKKQTDKREHLQFDDKRVASIVKRLENAADKDAVDKIMEQVNKFYTYDANVGNVFYAATKF